MLSLERLHAIAEEVIGAIPPLTPDMSAADVDGWDSLNNTLIAIEVAVAFDIDFDGEAAAACATFGDYLAEVNRRIERSRD